MRKQIYPLEVIVDYGKIFITQGGVQEDEQVVVVTEEQADILCSWINLAADEIRKSKRAE